jgi:LysM repeat protein
MPNSKIVGPGFRPIGAQKPTFHEKTCPPGYTVGRDAKGGFMFVPWARAGERKPTRDSAPPKTRALTHDALERIIPVMADIGARINRIEQQRAQQKQIAEQQQIVQQRPPTAQPNHQPMPTQDHAPCACQHVLTPQPTKDGVNTMQRNPQLAPLRGVTFDAPSHRTRDQNNFGEKPPSRFSSEENTRLSYSLPAGSAGPVPHGPDTKRANMELEHPTYYGERGAPIDWSGRDSKQQHNISGQPGAEARGSDLSEAFANELDRIPSGQPTAGLNAFNRAYHAAKTSDARDRVERIFRDWRASYDARGGMSPFMPRQPAHDAPWTGLYQRNAGVIGSNPDVIKPGQELDLGGGQSHTVQSGESLSSIASQYGGGGGSDLGGKSLAAERGGVYPTGGDYSSGGQQSGSTGGATSVPSELGSSAPTPPTRPAGLGGQQEASSPSSSSSSGETPTPPVKPASLGGTGESPSGTITPEVSEGGGGSSTGSEGTGLAKMVRGWVTGETE